MPKYLKFNFVPITMSTALMALVTSPPKSTCPGVSIRLIRKGAELYVTGAGKSKVQLLSMMELSRRARQESNIKGRQVVNDILIYSELKNTGKIIYGGNEFTEEFLEIHEEP